MTTLTNVSVKIFADGADIAEMLDLYARPFVRGFTTNPTLMARAGVRDYRAFAKFILTAIPDRPISFEVLADDPHEMEAQAREISRWGEHVYVKIPVSNTRAEYSYDLIERLSGDGIRVNVTAVLTLAQVDEVVKRVRNGAPSCVSVFAGRIADTGRDPIPIMAAATQLVSLAPQSELIWASPREVLNIFHAASVGCHIVTVTYDLLKKLPLIGRDLTEYSLETVKMFWRDAVEASLSLREDTEDLIESD